jgi:hypothetical protein
MKEAPHSVRSQKTAFFIVTAVKTSNLTQESLLEIRQLLEKSFPLTFSEEQLPKQETSNEEVACKARRVTYSLSLKIEAISSIEMFGFTYGSTAQIAHTAV